MDNLGIGSIVSHPAFGEGVVVELETDYYKIYFKDEEKVKSIGRDFDKLEVVEATEAPPQALDPELLERIVAKAVKKYIDPIQLVAMGGKWIGGKLLIEPGDPDLQGKEIPIETFFHKIVMVRDRLRVLEQNINSHSKLDDEDKVNLQQYITRAYGSLTTFNVLFNHKDYYFKGASKD